MAETVIGEPDACCSAVIAIGPAFDQSVPRGKPDQGGHRLFAETRALS